MQTDTKIRIDADELKLISDSSLFIKKRLITEKIIRLYNQLHSNLLQSPAMKLFPGFEELIAKPEKISKGENLNGQPYIMMDFPASFSNTDVLAFRSLFWWGHSFSFIWHIQGKYLESISQEKLIRLKQSKNNVIWASYDNSHWNYNIQKDFVPVADLEITGNNISGGGEKSLRIIKNLDLGDWKSIPDTGKGFFEKIIEILWL